MPLHGCLKAKFNSWTNETIKSRFNFLDLFIYLFFLNGLEVHLLTVLTWIVCKEGFLVSLSPCILSYPFVGMQDEVSMSIEVKCPPHTNVSIRNDNKKEF
uniref:Uncharacterized protein n=1 Tax=Physcomitrium patens TaxID=3218 RepID=A0A2K1IIP2_PHYPA|nr:hypothetical protein PHYPA_027838 [Physcomitrium patens]